MSGESDIVFWRDDAGIAAHNMWHWCDQPVLLDETTHAPEAVPARAMRPAGDPLARLAVRLRDDPEADMRAVAEWAELGGVGDLRAFVADCDSRGEMHAKALNTRNRAMRAAVALRWPDLPPGPAARLLWRALDSYRASGWQSDRKGSNPHAAGSLRYHLFEALAACPNLLGEKQIGRVIRAAPPR